MSVSRETLTGLANVSRETHERLEAFVGLLIAWNDRINLISKGDVPVVWPRHIADALQLLPLLPPVTGAIDLGSGGGFPALVLAIASGIPFTLIEADARKSAFLREAARVTHAPVTVLTQRAETARCAVARLITARALAPLGKLLELGTPLLAAGGTFLFLKGANAEAEIAQASLTWTMRVERHISQTGGGGVILRISEVERA